MKNENPYSNNSPYTINNPYQSTDNSVHQQMKAQRQLEKERKRQQYKFACEQAIDSIVYQFLSASHNKLRSWDLNSGEKATVVRYFKRYWDNRFISLALLALVTTFILSFYTKYAFFGIFIVFILREVFSQRVFLTYMLNDHELSRKQITEIKDKIFYKQLKTMRTLMFTFFLMAISLLSYIYSVSIFVEPQKYQKTIEILSKISQFHGENELFAYANVGIISILLLLKIYEKWSK